VSLGLAGVASSVVLPLRCMLLLLAFSWRVRNGSRSSLMPSIRHTFADPCQETGDYDPVTKIDENALVPNERPRRLNQLGSQQGSGAS
jgi:hypothetical protein